MRACIIGAGAAGLCAARHTAFLAHWTPTVYELSGKVGGVWVYDEGKSEDYEHGWRSSMYKNLRTNLPKEVMAFPDFPFPPSLPSFIGHQDVQRYLEAYADHFGLLKYIKFNHAVIAVDRSVTNGHPWQVSVKNLVTMEVTTETFDAIFVCNGHYSKPIIPSLPGATEFRGLQMHSASYRTPQQFSNMRVACLGAGPSGIDIALDLCAWLTRSSSATKRHGSNAQCRKIWFSFPRLLNAIPTGSSPEKTPKLGKFP